MKRDREEWLKLACPFALNRENRYVALKCLAEGCGGYEPEPRYEPGEQGGECPNCKGEGETSRAFHYRSERCGVCQGTGRVRTIEAGHCRRLDPFVTVNGWIETQS